MIGIGLAFVAGAAVLAWFSAVATMRLERTGAEPARLEQADGEPVAVTMETRLFGLIDIGHQRIDGVRSVSLIRSRQPGSDSYTPDHMVFETTAGPVNVGRPQQLFARDFDAIKTFFEDQTQRQTSLSSIERSAELRRFIFAQIAVVFLAFVGLALVRVGYKSL